MPAQDFRSYYLHVGEQERQRLAHLRQKRPIHSKTEYLALQAQEQTSTEDPRKTMERIDRALDYLRANYKSGEGLRLARLQKRFMRETRTAILQIVFGKQLKYYLPWIRERYGIKEVYRLIAVIFPRRAGKTVAQCIAAAVLQVALYDGNFVVFNLTGRQARAWLKQYLGYLETFQDSAEFGYTIESCDIREAIMIKARATGTKNTVSSFPGSQGSGFNNLRGMGVHIKGVFIDEAFFFETRAMEVILPLLRTGAFLIMTSSLPSGDARHGVMAILDAELNGTLLVRQVNFIRACDECRIAHREDQCNHTIQRPEFFHVPPKSFLYFPSQL